jgi:acyl-lipid omega-6 desaturase (Delta-12 desaturase)
MFAQTIFSCAQEGTVAAALCHVAAPVRRASCKLEQPGPPSSLDIYSNCLTVASVPLLLIVLPPMIAAAIIGVWLFSPQHRFDGVHWSRREEWNALSASLQGSSHLRLPRPLRWLTGNIGFHHVHHFDPKIPNYRLERCHFSQPAFQSAPVVTLRSGLSGLRYCLWDEERGAMVRIPRR